jgi:hypothetical protein
MPHTSIVGGNSTNMTKKARIKREAVARRKQSREFKREREKTSAVGCKTRFVRAIRQKCPGMRITRSMLDELMGVMTQVSVDHFCSVRCMLGERTIKPVDVYRHQAIMSGTNPGLISIIRQPAGAIADQILEDLRASQYTSGSGDKVDHIDNLDAMVSDKETIRRTWAICGAIGIDPVNSVARVKASTIKAKCSITP